MQTIRMIQRTAKAVQRKKIAWKPLLSIRTPRDLRNKSDGKGFPYFAGSLAIKKRGEFPSGLLTTKP